MSDDTDGILVHLKYLASGIDELRVGVADVRRDMKALEVRRHEADIQIEQRLARVESGLKIALSGGLGGGVGFPAMTMLYQLIAG